jgi:hypothetical protein
MSTVTPRVVVVTRPTELEAVLERYGTREQARFLIEHSGMSLRDLEARHARRDEALAILSAAVPLRWRRTRIDRADLSRFVFGPEDVVVVVGQDGLVANVSKYLTGQPVLGVNSDRDRYDGVLVRHTPEAAADLLSAAAAGRCRVDTRTMVEARTDDGQRLLALNEIFVGHRTHQSARYRIRWNGADEPQSSSGVIVASGTGATGWARSIARRIPNASLPSPTDRELAFFVREPFPSRTTGTTIEHGLVPDGKALAIVSEMNERGAAFGDGIEDDCIELPFGRGVEVGVAPTGLRLIAA